jgi:hypothetical protein
LTRQPGRFNPYVPWSGDPAGALLGPLGLLVMLRWRKRSKGGKMDLLLVLLVVGLAFGLSLAACNGEGPVGGQTETPIPTGDQTPQPSPSPSQPGGTPLSSTTLPTPSPTCTPTGTPTPTFIGEFIMSAYYIPTEEQYRSIGGAKVPIPAVKQRSIDIVGDPNVILYLSKTHQYDYIWNTDNLRTAIWGFLYDTEEGVCMQGSGKLDSGEYISCTSPQGTAWEDVRFDWQLDEKVNRFENSVVEFETVAVPPDLLGLLPFGTEIEIPDLAPYINSYNADTTFTVTDTGEGLGTNVSGEAYPMLDLFVGEGQPGLDAYYELIRAFPRTIPVYVYRK